MYYDEETKGFYRDTKKIDKKTAISLTQAQYKSVLKKQAEGGQIIVKNGKVSTKKIEVIK